MFQKALITQLERALAPEHPKEHEFVPMEGDDRVCGKCAWTPKDHPQHAVLAGILEDLKAGSLLVEMPTLILFVEVPLRPRRSRWFDLFS